MSSNCVWCRAEDSRVPANCLDVVKVQATADSVFGVKLKGGCPVLGVNDHSQFSLRSLFSFG